MAILTGVLMYRGSFKSIRNYRKFHDPKTYAGEKGGANRDLIMNNPAFARTRENMTEFGGCGAAVKSIRRGLQNLLPEQSDAHFTGRLMKMTKKINLCDSGGIRGRRSILFSVNRSMLCSIVFNDRLNLSEMLQLHYSCSHTASREEATLSITDLNLKQVYIPAGATHYRVQNHLSIISDWFYSEVNRRYEPVNPIMNAKSTFIYSPFIEVFDPLSTELIASFPTGNIPTNDCTVIQCIGVDFFIQSAANTYLLLKGSTMKVADVF